MKATKESLQESLAEHIRIRDDWMAWTEIPLGSVLHHYGGVQRADVLAMMKSYRLRVVIYECKTSRTDFLSDVNRGKYEGYLTACHQLYFAVPRGLVKRAEVPEGCGLMVYSRDKGWHTIVAAPVRSAEIKYEFLLTCLFRGHDESIERRRLKDQIVLRENVRLADRAKTLGWKIAQRIGSTEAEWERIHEAHKLIDDLTGTKTRDLASAVFHLQYWLRSRAPGIEFIDQAVDLVSIARDLIMNEGGSLNQYGALHRLTTFVNERQNGHDNGAS